MPRYYFDINDGTEIRDEIGREIASGPLLRAEALRVASQLIQAETSDASGITLILNVRNEAGFSPLRLRLVCEVEEQSQLYD